MKTVRDIVAITQKYADEGELIDRSGSADHAATHNELQLLQWAVADSRRVTALLRDRGDRRGLFGVGLDVVEANAVLPFQRSTFDPARPAIARISLNLLTSYLSAAHAEFSGEQPPAHWKRYFDLAVADCGSPSVALTAYDAHLTVDLAYGVDLGVLWRGIPANIPLHDLRREAIVVGNQVYSVQAFRLGIDLRQSRTLAQTKGVMQSQWNAIDAELFRNDVLRICTGTAAMSVS